MGYHNYPFLLDNTLWYSTSEGKRSQGKQRYTSLDKNNTGYRTPSALSQDERLPQYCQFQVAKRTSQHNSLLIWEHRRELIRLQYKLKQRKIQPLLGINLITPDHYPKLENLQKVGLLKEERIAADHRLGRPLHPRNKRTRIITLVEAPCRSPMIHKTSTTQMKKHLKYPWLWSIITTLM